MSEINCIVKDCSNKIVDSILSFVSDITPQPTDYFGLSDIGKAKLDGKLEMANAIIKYLTREE